MSHSGSGGVAVRAGPSPRLGGGRAKLRRAQRRAAAKIRSARPDEIADESQFACALLCGRCGQLGWPEATRTTLPHRRDARAPAASVEPCSHCEDTSWIDLRRGSTALALRDGENFDNDDEGTRNREIALNASLATVIGGFMGLVTIGFTWPVLAVGACAGVAAGLYKRREFRRGSPAPSVLPRRWSMALPVEGTVTSTHRGRIALTDEALRSPLTGRRCAAWEVGLRDDDDHEGELSSWALLEQHVEALTVDGRSIDPDETHLQLSRQSLGRISQLSLDEPALVYLRQRGFTPGDADLHVYETVVETDVGAVVTMRPGGSTLSTEAAHGSGA
jgi:hypothetical protein